MADRQILRGDTLVFDLQILRSTDPTVAQVPLLNPDPTQQPLVPVNITGYFMWFTAKFHASDPDSQATAQSTSTPSSTPPGGGIVFTEATSGKAEVTMAAPATQNFPDGPVVLSYDVQVKDVSGRIFTVETGTLTVSPDVTRALV